MEIAPERHVAKHNGRILIVDQSKGGHWGWFAMIEETGEKEGLADWMGIEVYYNFEDTLEAAKEAACQSVTSRVNAFGKNCAEANISWTRGSQPLTPHMKATITLRFYDGEFWIEITDEATGNTERLTQVYDEPDDVAAVLQKLGLTLSQTQHLVMQNAMNLGTASLSGVTVPRNYASIQ
jgi:hypothetical protein